MKNIYTTNILLLFTSCIFACSSVHWARPQSISFNDQLPPTYVCTSVPQEQFNAVKLAFDDWNKALVTWKRFVVVENGGSGCSYFIEETNENKCQGDGLTIACANAIGGNTTYLRRGRYEKRTKEIVMHEFGHVLGAQHVQGTLMDATYDDHLYACPDVTTVAQVAAYNKLNLAQLSWCYR
jgi:hypothetical protein